MPRGVPNNREVHTADMPIRKFDALDLTEPTASANLIDNIDPVNPDLMPKTQADRIAFFEEPLEIRIEPGRERNPQKLVPLGLVDLVDPPRDALFRQLPGQGCDEDAVLCHVRFLSAWPCDIIPILS